METFLDWVREEHWSLEIFLFLYLPSKNLVGPLDSFLSSGVSSLLVLVLGWAGDPCRADECKCTLPWGWPSSYVGTCRAYGQLDAAERVGSMGSSWCGAQDSIIACAGPGVRPGGVTILAPPEEVTDRWELVLSCLLLPHLITCPLFLSLTQKEKQFFWRTHPSIRLQRRPGPQLPGKCRARPGCSPVLTSACSEWGWLPLAQPLLWGLHAVAGSSLHVFGNGQALLWWLPAAQWSISSVKSQGNGFSLWLAGSLRLTLGWLELTQVASVWLLLCGGKYHISSFHSEWCNVIKW